MSISSAMSWLGFFFVWCMKSRKNRSATIPSRSGRCIANPHPPDSSPPIIASVSIIFGAMYLKPTGTSYTGTPYFWPRRSTMALMFTVFTTGLCAHVHGLHARLAQLAHLEQVPHEERVQRQRRDEVSLLVSEPGAVGVSV